MFDSMFKRPSHLGHEIIMTGHGLSRSLLKNAWHRDWGCKGTHAWIQQNWFSGFLKLLLNTCILQYLPSFRKQQCTRAWNWTFRMLQGQLFDCIPHILMGFFFFSHPPLPHYDYFVFRFTTGRWITRTRRKKWRSSFYPRRACVWKTWPATRTTWSNCLRLTRLETVLSVSPGGGALFSQVRLCVTLLHNTSLYSLLPVLGSAGVIPWTG